MRQYLRAMPTPARPGDEESLGIRAGVGMPPYDIESASPHVHFHPVKGVEAVSVPATIYVVDDDPAVIRALVSIGQLLSVPVKSFASPLAFLESCDRHATGCLVAEIKMPEMTGLELQQKLVEENITLPVIMISGHADVRLAVEVMSRGAFTLLEKPFHLEEMITHVRKAIETDASNRIARTRKAEAEAQLAQLTFKEREVLDLVAAGKTNKQIAADLHLSIRAVEDRRARLMKKLGVRSIAELVQWRTVGELPARAAAGGQENRTF